MSQLSAWQSSSPKAPPPPTSLSSLSRPATRSYTRDTFVECTKNARRHKEDPRLTYARKKLLIAASTYSLVRNMLYAAPINGVLTILSLLPPSPLSPHTTSPSRNSNKTRSNTITWHGKGYGVKNLNVRQCELFNHAPNLLTFLPVQNSTSCPTCFK